LSGADAPIEVVAHDPAWAERFARERVALEAAIGEWIVAGPEHVGSTAVPGLAAKPVVDILVGVADLRAARACFRPLAALGYLRWEDDPAGWRYWFLKPSPALRTHHLQLVEPSHPRWAATLTFRDRLRASPETRQAYAALKRRLAVEFRHDRERYTAGKTAFVSAVLDGTWAGPPAGLSGR
jgi:GrpB-like predicted nucleotidyltransferase (UPF0157 family)